MGEKEEGGEGWREEGLREGEEGEERKEGEEGEEREGGVTLGRLTSMMEDVLILLGVL